MSASVFCNCFCVTSCHNVYEEQVACIRWHRDAVVGLAVSKIVVIDRPLMIYYIAAEHYSCFSSVSD